MSSRRLVHHRRQTQVRTLVPGVVYVLRSEKYPGVYKVGRTAWRAEWRAEQLAGEVGYRGFGPFSVIYERETHDTLAVEAKAHATLRNDRIRLRCGARELFRASEKLALSAVEAAALQVEAAQRIASVWRPAPVPQVSPPAPDYGWLYWLIALAVLAGAFALSSVAN